MRRSGRDSIKNDFTYSQEQFACRGAEHNVPMGKPKLERNIAEGVTQVTAKQLSMCRLKLGPKKRARD